MENCEVEDDEEEEDFTNFNADFLIPIQIAIRDNEEKMGFRLPYVDTTFPTVCDNDFFFSSKLIDVKDVEGGFN